MQRFAKMRTTAKKKFSRKKNTINHETKAAFFCAKRLLFA